VIESSLFRFRNEFKNASTSNSGGCLVTAAGVYHSDNDILYERKIIVVIYII